jgi:hypothetical protein
MDDLDRTLLSEEPLSPSPGFLPAVMRAVRRQTEAPPPLPFPWRRAAATASACALALATILTLSPSGPVAATRAVSDMARAVAGSVPAARLGELALALLASLLAVRGSVRAVSE